RPAAPQPPPRPLGPGGRGPTCALPSVRRRHRRHPLRRPFPMKFGMFYEHQLPRPWGPDSEHQLLKDALDQVELADKLGLDYVWEVEHHFLEEHSHSSAPEVFLAACSQRTIRTRLVHGIVPIPVNLHHPARDSQ